MILLAFFQAEHTFIRIQHKLVRFMHKSLLFLKFDFEKIKKKFLVLCEFKNFLRYFI